jgi:hypothetical protein
MRVVVAQIQYIDGRLQEMVVSQQRSQGAEYVNSVRVISVYEKATTLADRGLAVSVEKGRVNAQSLEIKNEVWVFVAGGRRVETNVEFWIPKSHSLGTGITENGE